ncbi:MAG: hypothetical protein KA161_06425 [Saprospiraceae bacterium]|nr:hypothetical protein [Saprospiraceae bacterium]
MTILAIFLWTNTSPGRVSVISFAGTRLSAHPIHNKGGDCPFASLEKYLLSFVSYINAPFYVVV